MNQVPQTRTGKIRLLKMLLKGHATVQDIMPVKFQIWVQEGNKYVNRNTGEELTEEQWQERPKKDKSIIRFTLDI